MDVIVIMCIGVLAGKFLLPRNLNRWNQILQVVCTLLLIYPLTRRFLENKKTGKGRK